MHRPTPRPGDQAFDVIRVLPRPDASGAGPVTRPLPRSAHRARWAWRARTDRLRPRAPVAVLDPALRDTLNRLGGSARLQVLVTFRDTVQMPRFPALDPRRTRGQNKGELLSIADIVRRLRANRDAEYAVDSDFLQTHGGRVLDRFWLVRAYPVEMRADSIRRLPLARSDLVQVRLDRGREPPGHDGDSRNDMQVAIARIGTAPWYRPHGSGRIAMLDTGVFATHQLLSDPSSFCLIADCTSPADTLADPTMCGEDDHPGRRLGIGDRDTAGHGTSTAGILVGNAREPGSGRADFEAFRGVTHASLDAFVVYGEDNHVRATAAIRGFELALERGAQVIVAEMQEGDSSDVGGIDRAAENAYDLGAIVIAAGGNDTRWGLGVPARARKVIGVGAHELGEELRSYRYAMGRTPDGRFKPDLLAPTGTETAANLVTDRTRYHLSTSGATPYAAGAALMLENWVTWGPGDTRFRPDPGQVHALLLVACDSTGWKPDPRLAGVGRLTFDSLGNTEFGKSWVDKSVREVDIPITLSREGAGSITAAIWWPEVAVVESTHVTTEVPAEVDPTAQQQLVEQDRRERSTVPVDTHNNLDLELRTEGPFGKSLAQSDNKEGVFERIHTGLAETGNAKVVLRVRPTEIRTKEPQVFYWAVTFSPAAAR